MEDPTLPLAGLSPVSGKPIKASFDGGMLPSDAGILVLWEVEKRLDVSERLAGCLDDTRVQEQVVHSLADMIRFRVMMIAAGYEDGNDASSLRVDPAFELAQDWLPSGRDLAANDLPSGEPARHPLAAVGAALPKTISNPGKPTSPPIAPHAPRRPPTSSGCSCIPAPAG